MVNTQLLANLHKYALKQLDVLYAVHGKLSLGLDRVICIAILMENSC